VERRVQCRDLKGLIDNNPEPHVDLTCARSQRQSQKTKTKPKPKKQQSSSSSRPQFSCWAASPPPEWLSSPRPPVSTAPTPTPNSALHMNRGGCCCKRTPGLREAMPSCKAPRSCKLKPARRCIFATQPAYLGVMPEHRSSISVITALGE
jgi:hypothetical protein